MFPSLPSTYVCESYPDHLVYIPRRLEHISVLLKHNNAGEDSIPCLLVPSPGYYYCLLLFAVATSHTLHRSNKYMIYSHGNGCDLGNHFTEFHHYASHFGVNVLAYEVW